ncbi:MAG: hypothetical protein IPM63_10715 [Acidobacteriota bacterium]|nr:MAG: hypothetical protein IPM63_10715 [Acidobacteriota bacterium]
MNSEELEQSLRAEFENYLKDVFSEIKQEISGFQQKLDSEFKDHRARVDAALEELSQKALLDRSIEESFRESVTEHLRLAKDEGARITAMAIAEAEELHGSASAAEEIHASFQGLRDAIADISSKDSQAEILKALVHHATEHTPRGAFFIVKNEHLVGWRVFGREDHDGPDVVRELFFPLSAKTALGEAVETLATVSGFAEGYEDEEIYLQKLGFEPSARMVAIPLVARGRGVAVLYADGGENGGEVNSEALESLVCVSGLTVELLASGAGPHIAEAHETYDDSSRTYDDSSYGTSDFAAPGHQDMEDAEAGEPALEEDVEEVYAESPSTEYAADDADVQEAAESGTEPRFGSEEEAEEATTGFSFAPAEPVAVEEEEYEDYEDDLGSEYAEPIEASDDAAEVGDAFADPFEPAEEQISAEDRFEAEVEELYDVSESIESLEPEPADAVAEDAFDSAVEIESESSFELVEAEPEPAEISVEGPEEAEEFEYSSLEEEAEKAEAAFEETAEEEELEEEPTPSPEPAVVTEPAAVADSGPAVRSRFGDRNIDLPIEVPEDERQYHNAARRFARLLVSEIKLYNEQKVKEGCEANDLYDRLKEAIDRSREMYEKRVHGPVAERFDYFNFELVNNLAQGDESKLGGSYPGSRV